MSLEIKLTHAALNDLYSISDYYLKQVSSKVASRIISKLQTTILSLGNQPERGSIPNELEPTGITRYRQIKSQHYRIIYRVGDKCIFVVMVIDVRRDVATALLRRLQV